MRAILFGATEMIGQGDLRELLHADLLDCSDVGDAFAHYDALFFFCLGASSGAMSEDAYRKITLDLPLAAKGFAKKVLESQDINEVR